MKELNLLNGAGAVFRRIAKWLVPSKSPPGLAPVPVRSRRDGFRSARDQGEDYLRTTLGR